MIKYNPYNLTDRRILITGASSGIGRQTAISCSKMGAQICLVGRNEERLSETESALTGGGHQKIVLDLTDPTKVAETVASLPNLDGVVHSVGNSRLLPARMMSLEVLNKLMNDNFMSSANFMHHLLARNKINSGASIIFLSSISARTGIKGLAGYSAAKAATLAYARTLAQELAKKNIRVNTISPASVNTPIWGPPETRPILNEVAKVYPMGIGEPEDVANTAIYLLSEAGRWMTGNDVLLEGGLTHHI